MPRLRSSRRVLGLKESDYDHEIDLVDHDSPPASPRPLSSNGASNSGGPSPRRSGERQPSRAESSSKGKGKQVEPVVKRRSDEAAGATPQPGQDSRRGPSIEIQGKEPVKLIINPLIINPLPTATTTPSLTTAHQRPPRTSSPSRPPATA